MKVRFQKILDFFITFTVWAFFAHIAIHSLGHALATELLGGTATVRFQGVFAEMVTPIGLSPAEYQIMAFSGGLFAALAMGLLWWRARASPTHWDLDDEVVLASFAGMHLLYGIVEGTTLGATGYMGVVPQSFMILAPLAMAVGFLTPLFLYIFKVADWLMEGS